MRKTARRAPTVADLAADYLERHAVPKKRPKSVRDDGPMLNNIILPKLGTGKVDAIGRRDVEAIHIAMQDRPYQANRVISLLSRMFSLAIEWKWRPSATTAISNAPTPTSEPVYHRTIRAVTRVMRLRI